MPQEADIDSSCLLEVKGEQAPQIWEELDKAVVLAIRHANKSGWHGVLVTQHNTCHYTLAVTEKVPTEKLMNGG